MKLKHIEMLGFKSFAEKTRLEFDSPISCIVGPNGCGKSNVVDSIRWCIGEMSWKSLRSASMADIIFNGTAKRPPQNMAEVNMVFDNFSKKLPIDFDEVTVTRKVYRTGESEYFLNKVQCRLKDIRDLFLDTGIGSEGYAIIDQGGVNFILKAKPEERRELFEEAAGVSKYKAKRDEAIKRLEKVDADLARLSDTAVLIGQQIKALDLQARKARLYKRYKEQLRDSEIAIAVKTALETETKLNDFRDQLKPILEEISTKQMVLDKLEGEISALNLNLTHKQAEISEFNRKIANCKYETGRLEGDITNFENLVTELKNQIENFDKEDAVDGKRKEELTPQIEKLTSEVTAFDRQIEPLTENYNGILTGLREKESKLSEIGGFVEKLNGKMMTFSQKELEFSRQTAFDQSAIGHITENLINLEKERNGKEKQLSDLQEELDTIKSDLENQNGILSAIVQNIKDVKNKKEVLKTEKLILEEKILKLKNENAASNAKLEMISLRRRKDPYWLGTRSIIDAGIEGISGILRENLQTDPQDKIYIEEVFGKFLDSIICQNNSVCRNAIEVLKSKGNLRAKFIILDALEGIDKASLMLDDKAERVKSQMSYPHTLENLVHYILSQHQLKGSVEKFWVAGGAENIEPPADYWGKEEGIKEEIKLNETSQSDVKKRLEDVIDAVSKTESEISSLKQKHNEESVKQNTLSNLIETKKESLRSRRESISFIRTEKENLTAQKAEKEKNLAEIEKNLGMLSENRDKTASEIANLKTLRDELQSGLSDARAEAETLSGQLNKLKNEKVNLQADSKSLQMQEHNIAASVQKRALERTTNQNRITEFEEKKLYSAGELKNRRDELAKLEVEQTRIQEELTALKSEYDGKSAEADGYKTRKSKLDLQAGELETEIKNISCRTDEIEENLKENWQTDINEAKLKYRDFKIDYDKVKGLRRRIENMGPVNMTAPEEYDALNGKHEFLSSQIGDLESAKSDLKSAINKINSTTRENFRSTFERVRENFQKIYQILFEGGEADLILTQPENLLETGVEIVTRPPGKRTQNISSLSGGEQALTALSLLFSFFVVNPSPFCILDEADAPLDEANIDRFVRLLKQFVKNTQFLIVTHNKRTMESADTLYGITMQESGVSKVVSVELDRKGELKGLPQETGESAAVA